MFKRLLPSFLPFLAISGQNAEFAFANLKSNHIELETSWMLRKSRNGTLYEISKTDIWKSLNSVDKIPVQGMIVFMIPGSIAIQFKKLKWISVLLETKLDAFTVHMANFTLL